MTAHARRVVVAVLGIPLLLGAVYLGGMVFAVLVALIALLAAGEAYRLLVPEGGAASLWILRCVALAIPVLDAAGRPDVLLPLCLTGLLLGILPAMRRDPVAGTRQAVAVLFVIVYPLLALIHLFWLRQDFGPATVYLLLALIWVGDTAAYEGGKRTGRRKLALRLSPNKTIEGALWSLAGSVVVAMVFWRGQWVPGSLTRFLIAAVCVWCLGTVGDLFESMLKRAAGVKDTSRLLSEHGGVLDRFDSLAFAGVGVYYLLHWSV